MAGCATLCGCLVYVAQPSTPPPKDPVEPASVLVLSAHHSAQSLVSEGGAGRVVVVMSDRLDPASLDARDFLVNLSDGRWMFPERAVLDPASGYGRNRSVSLLGAFESPPVAINIVKGLYTEAGEPVPEHSAEVRPIGEPDRMVYAEWIGASGNDGCETVVRTHWSDAIDEVLPELLVDVELTLREGPMMHPLGLVTDSVSDNVVDFCVGAMPITRIGVPADFAVDHTGVKTVAASVTVTREGE